MTNGKNMLFLTNFSEACFRAIPALTEWIDREEGQLTILNVHAPGRNEEAEARKRMRSFFAEADRFAKCERALLSGNPESVVLDYCRQEAPSIVFAPASHPSALPRMMHRSLRAALLRHAGVRIWTRGRNGHITARRHPENVAYVITGHADWPKEAQAAAKTAVRHGARLHLIHLTPIQAIHDGTLASEISIGHPNVSTDQLLRLIESLPLPPVVHSSTGDEVRELPRLLREADADMVFLGERHAVRRNLFGYSVDPALEKLGCEVICFPRQSAAMGTAGREESKGLVLQPMFMR